LYNFISALLKSIPSKDETEDVEVAETKSGSGEEISPLTASIADFKKTTEMRKRYLKNSNYIFQNNTGNIEELEKEPAYKRQKIELNDAPPSDEISSRTSIDFDEKNEIQLRSNNSFLHDNVD